jgi:hypothetical protein
MPGALLAVVLLLLPGAPDRERADGWVVLPVAEYRDLRSKAYPPSPPPEPLAIAALLTRVEYDLRVDGDAAKGRARLFVDVLREGYVSVPAPAGLLVREARLDGRPVALIDGPSSKASSAPSVLLARPGRSVLELDVVVPVVSAAGTETLTVPQSTAAITRVTLSVPRQGVDLRVSGGLLVESTPGPVSRFVAHGGGGGSLALSWRRKVDDQRASVPLRLRATLTQIVGLAEESAQLTAQVELEAAQGQAERVRITLPPGLAVNQVSGPLVADWETSADALTVRFLEPLRDRTSLMIVGEARCPREGRIEAPLVRVSGVERESGGVAVEVLGAGEIRKQETRGLEAADPSDLGPAVAARESPSLAAFRFRPQDGQTARALAVELVRYTPEAILVANVDEARYRVLVSDDGKTLAQARYAVRNNQRAFMAVRLPEGATLWSASVAGRAVRPGRSADGALLLPLQKGKAGEEAPAFAVEVSYFGRSARWSEKGREQITLPAVDLPVSKSGLEVRHSPRFRVTGIAGAFRPAAFEAPAAAVLADLPETPPPPPPPPKASVGTRESFATSAGVAQEQQALIDRFQEGRARRVAGVLPVRVPFPEIGPVLFVVSELTAEAQAPTLGIDYRREGK